MKKDTKTILKISSLLLIIIGILVSIYLIKNKYDKVEILSLKQEYNIVYSSNLDTINIPLYFKRDNSYLSRNSQIDSVSLSNENTILKANLKSITTGQVANYKEDTFYEFIFSLSFPYYDDFNEPIFISDCEFNIKYKNGNTLSFEIGNVNVLFNTNIKNNGDINLVSLSAVTNEVDSNLTIVGINLSLVNELDRKIKLDTIKINNKNYELSYLDYSLDKVDTKKVLTKDKSYSYFTNEIESGDMSLIIDPNEKVDIFVPLRYLDNILIVNNIPLYIEYEIDGNKNMFIIDDFTFFNKIDPLNIYEVKTYVYSY